MTNGVLQPNEIVTFRFEASDSFWIRAHQASMIEGRLDRHPDEFYVKSVDYWQPGSLVFKIRVKENSPKLWTERKIAELISQYNPTGLKLAFKESVREFVEEVVEPAVKTGLFIGLAILAGWLYFTYYRGPESWRRTPQTAESDV